MYVDHFARESVGFYGPDRIKVVLMEDDAGLRVGYVGLNLTEEVRKFAVRTQRVAETPIRFRASGYGATHL